MASICYAWMLSSKGDGQAAVPVVNMRRSRMARCRQAAWLLYHVGVDASALLFVDEVHHVILMCIHCASSRREWLWLAYGMELVSDRFDNCLGPRVIECLFEAEARQQGWGIYSNTFQSWHVGVLNFDWHRVVVVLSEYDANRSSEFRICGFSIIR